jgi:hypothetical protein
MPCAGTGPSPDNRNFQAMHYKGLDTLTAGMHTACMSKLTDYIIDNATLHSAADREELSDMVTEVKSLEAFKVEILNTRAALEINNQMFEVVRNNNRFRGKYIPA